MFPHRMFAQYCMQKINSYNTGFLLLPSGELLLRDKDNELTIYMVVARKRNKAILLSNTVSAYRRSCDLFFHYLSLPTRMPDTLNAVLYEDTWPEYKISPVPLKRLAPESESEMSEIKRSKVNEQKYRYRVDMDRIAMFQTTDKLLVDKFVLNIQKYAVVAWGMVEQLLERTRNPFRLIPLFTYGYTAAEWLNNVLTGADVSSMASSIGKYEEYMLQEVLYRDDEKNFVVAKRFGETPLVFLNDPERERPVKDCPEAFMTALFFYFYAGGTKGTMRMIDESYLKFCLLEPVTKPLICEENEQLAATTRYKRVLIDITDGRTQEEILSQFDSVEDLATHLIVDPAELKFDITTVYVHPENRRVIKSANRVCRWTNLTVNPPAQHYVKDAQIREALIMSSGEVEMEAIKALANEADLSLFQTLYMFSDCTLSFTDDELKDTFSKYWDNLVRSDRLNVKLLKEITVQQLQLKQRYYSDYVEIDSAIVYGGGKFHAVDQSLSLLKSLNEDEQLQLLQMSNAPLVSNLFTVNLDLVPYLIKASNGKLALPLQQAETLQKNVCSSLKSILQNAFTTGPWKHLTTACNIAATLQAAFENKDSYWREFDQFWEWEQKQKKSSALVPFYLVKNTDLRLFIYYSKDHGCVVFEIKDDVIERRDDLTLCCNNYDGAQLLYTELANDGDFIAFVLHLIYIKREECRFRYDDVLNLCKQNVFTLARLYNLSFTDAESFAIFDAKTGEDLLTYFVEETFFSLTKIYDSSTAVNVVAVMKEFSNEKNFIETISTEGGTLFVSNTTIPVLYLYSGVNANEMLHHTLFDLWLASDMGNVGFFILPIESDDDDMQTDSGNSPHCLTLVYTTELFNVPLPQPVRLYGNNQAVIHQHLSDTYQKLIKWAVDLDLTAEDVSDVVSSHTMTLLRYRNNTNNNKRFSINYFDKRTVNNTLSVCNEDILKRITPKRHTCYASLQVSDQEFALLFSRKTIR